MATKQKTPQPETFNIPADADGVCCDGGGGPLGHPKVWYTFDRDNRAECTYCDRLFIRKS